MSNNQTMDLAVECRICNQVYIIEGINPEHYAAWHNGLAFIQDVMSYLSPADRELLISRTCDVCWTEMFEHTIKIEKDNS